MRRKIPDLAQALTGTFDAHHAQLARSMLRRLDLVEQALAELDAVIAEACRPWQHQIELLQTIPGVGPTVAQVIIAETGADMSRFPTAAHLAAWAGLAPAMNESAGKQTPAGKRHGNKWLTAMLVEAAGSVGRMHGKNYLAVKHARLTRRRGMGGPRSRSRTRSWSPLTTCCSAISPTPTSARTGTNAQRPSPHPPACRPARTSRTHRDPRPSRLSTGFSPAAPVPPDAAAACPWRVFTGLCGTSDFVSRVGVRRAG